jgi:hypothetical protein
MAALASSYAVFPLLLAAYNWTEMGHPLATGYALTGEQLAFSVTGSWAHFCDLMTGLNGEALFMVAPLGLLGLVLAGSPAERLLKVLWFAPLALLYSGYYWMPPGMASWRFLLATFPLLIGCAFALLEHRLPPRTARWTALGLLLFVLAIRGPAAMTGAAGLLARPNTRNLAAMARRCAERLPRDAVIFGEWPAFCYVGTRESFRFYDLAAFRPRKVDRNGTWESPRMQEARFQRLRRLYGEHSPQELIGMKRDLVTSFLDRGREVALLIPEASLASQRQELGEGFELVVSTTWEQDDWFDHHAQTTRRWGIWRVRPAAAIP